jgi:hypothetical protein
VDTLGINYSIMTHVPNRGGPISRHIVMDDADLKPGPGRLSLPLMLSRDGYWCMYTRYSPRIPLCPDCRQWLRDRSHAVAEAQAVVSFYEVASETVATEGKASGR